MGKILNGLINIFDYFLFHIWRIKLYIKSKKYRIRLFFYNILWYIKRNIILLIIILIVSFGFVLYILISNNYHKNKYQQFSNRNIYLEEKIHKLEKELKHEKKQRRIEILMIKEKVDSLHDFIQRLYPKYDYDYKKAVDAAINNDLKIEDLPENLLKIYTQKKYIEPHGLDKYQLTLKNIQWPLEKSSSFVAKGGCEYAAYRPRPAYGWKHAGLDINTFFNNSVFAIYDSKVWRTYYTEGEGYCIEIKFRYTNSDGSFSWYFSRFKHLEIIYVKKGDDLKKGQVIATMGNTGISTAKHLHFEIWRYSKSTKKYYSINPVQNSTWDRRVVEKL